MARQKNGQGQRYGGLKVGYMETIETSLELTPRFDANGLIPAIAQDVQTGEVLMLAYMNRQALEETIRTRQAVYYSRSRKELWRKGQQSGHVQHVQQILVDCDQDCILLKVKVDAGQCHTGHRSCFYRALDSYNPNKLTEVVDKVFDPKAVY